MALLRRRVSTLRYMPKPKTKTYVFELLTGEFESCTHHEHLYVSSTPKSTVKKVQGKPLYPKRMLAVEASLLKFCGL